MKQESPLPPVQNGEMLARFILFSRWVRQDKKIRPAAFIPHPWPDLSVTRHIGLHADELWSLGEDVSTLRARPLLGRADIQAIDVMKQSLKIEPTPTPRNHANITGWPPDKSAQKSLAQELAAASTFVSRNDDT